MAQILIVDDNASNRQLLREILHNAFPHDTITTCENGDQCLALVEQQSPDIILLDVLMPQRDGYEVCRMLKNNPQSKHIPVILITALDTIEEKMAGFKVGASDFIVKPLHADETIARVNVHLQIKQYQDTLKAMNEELKRTQDALVHSAKMSAVGSLAAGVAHEFNNILSMLAGYVQMCRQKQDQTYFNQVVGIFEELVARGQTIVSSLHDFSRSGENMEKHKVQIGDLMKRDLALMNNALQKNGIQVIAHFEDIPAIDCYPSQISQVFINIIKNAIEAMQSSPTKELLIDIRTCIRKDPACPLRRDKTCGCPECIMIRIADTGIGMTPNVVERMFEPFVTTKGVLGGGNDSTPGTGLGMSISYGIVSRHGGRIFVEETTAAGTSIVINLPITKE